jgi:hypothetical protein
MTTAESVVKDIQSIEAVCEEIAANADKLNVHDAAKVATLKGKATAYLEHFRKHVPEWPKEQA